MNYLRNVIKFLVCASFVIPATALSCQRTLFFEEAWHERKFNGKTLSNVIHLYPSEETKLDAKRKKALCESQRLTHLKTLNLCGRDIDDHFIHNLCSNPTFSRLINLDLRHNPKITDASLKYIFESNEVGSIRDLPQISGRYGLASCEIYISTEGTSITKEAIRKYQNNPRYDFFIEYFHPAKDKRTAASSQGAIKLLQFN